MVQELGDRGRQKTVLGDHFVFVLEWERYNMFVCSWYNVLGKNPMQEVFFLKIREEVQV